MCVSTAAQRDFIVMMQFCNDLVVFSRRYLLQSSALVLVAPALAQVSETALPKLDSVLQSPDVKLLRGDVWKPQKQTASTLVVYC